MWRFPAIQTTRTEAEQARKVIDEVKEFLENPSDHEAIDVLHAVETFLRIRFKGREDVIELVVSMITEKNRQRGYYDQPCF